MLRNDADFCATRPVPSSSQFLAPCPVRFTGAKRTFLYRVPQSLLPRILSHSRKSCICLASLLRSRGCHRSRCEITCYEAMRVPRGPPEPLPQLLIWGDYAATNPICPSCWDSRRSTAGVSICMTDQDGDRALHGLLSQDMYTKGQHKKNLDCSDGRQPDTLRVVAGQGQPKHKVELVWLVSENRRQRSSCGSRPDTGACRCLLRSLDRASSLGWCSPIHQSVPATAQVHVP